jgi:hypothetical protein
MPLNNGERPLPHSEDGERGILSSWIQEPALVGDLCSKHALAPQHFYEPRCRLVYEALQCWSGTGPVEYLWLRGELKKRDQFEEIGGNTFLDELYNFIPTGKNGNWYIDAVLEVAHRRRAILGYEELAKAARDTHRPIEEFDPGKVFVDPTRCDPQVFTVHELFGFDREKDDTSRFGKRWLCQGDSLLISGPTGLGKSAFAMQMVVCWALGRPFFGIVTAGPLRILVIQSENNLGDLAIPFQDICGRIKISDQDKKRLAEQMVFVRESEKTGDAFIRLARKLITKHTPDVVLVDPLLSYVGADASRQDVMSSFLRNGIQPLLNETGIVWVFIHHNVKPPKDQGGKPTGGNAYSALGSSEILNWPREVLTFVVRDWERRVFTVEFRKRARQAGITTPTGALTHELVIRHSDQDVAWEACSIEEIKESEPETKGRKSQFCSQQLVSLLGSEILSHSKFCNKACAVLRTSKSTFKRLLKEAIKLGEIRHRATDRKYEVIQKVSP